MSLRFFHSPMMGEMLSYQESRSGAYVERAEGRVSRPDENFAREIMRLFTIGAHRLNIDGSEIKLKTEDGRSSIPMIILIFRILLVRGQVSEGITGVATLKEDGLINIASIQ